MRQELLNRLIIAAVLISIGCGLLYFLDNGRVSLNFDQRVGLWVSAGGLIGAGLFAPFKKPLWGLVSGIAFQILLFLLMTH
jgi:hypothetical protein